MSPPILALSICPRYAAILPGEIIKERPRSSKVAAAEPPATEGHTEGAAGGRKARKGGKDKDENAVNATQRLSKKKLRQQHPEEKESPERLQRTVFVGNVPIKTTAKALIAFLQQELNKKLGKTEGAGAAAAGAGAGAAAEGDAVDGEKKEAEKQGNSSKDIESVRFRSIPIQAVAVAPGSDYKAMLKAAVTTGSFAEDAKAMNGEQGRG